MIYVYYPRGAETGGPEALHQLVDSLRRQGQEAYLSVMPGFEGNPRVTAYEKYDSPEKVPKDDSIVVVPEIGVNILNQFPLSNKMIWWLAAGSPSQKDVIHLAQSQFAAEEIKKQGFEYKMLSDYTPLDYVKSMPNEGNIIAFNGNKGQEFVELVMPLVPNAKWIPIRGMSRNQVLDTLNTSSIYLDLGHHPGKDRLPREAAVSGATVVTSRRGSANYYSDIPIMNKVPHDNPETIATVLRFMLNDLSSFYENQKIYRDIISKEKETFDREVMEVFI